MDATVISPAEAVLAAVHADPRAASAAAQRIIDESTDERERVTARWALGFARRELSDLGQAETLMRAAIDGANQLGDVQLAARISTSLALVVMERDTPAAALELLEQPIAILRGADRARAVMQRGLIHYHLAQFDAALDDHHAAIDDLRAAGDWVALARLHVNVGSIQSYRRDFDAAEQSLADAIDLSELNGQALLAGYAHHNLGHLRALRGDVPEALRSFETAMERYTDLGAPPDRVATLMADRARTLSDAGLRAEAVEAIDIAYDLVRQGATDAEAADIGLLAASIRLENGEVERAVEPAAWARATYALRGRSGWAPVAELLLLRARVHEPDGKRAAEGCRLATDLERLGWIEEAQTALIFAADLFIRVGDVVAATRALDEAARLDAVTLRSRTARWLAMARRHFLNDDLDAARGGVDAGLSLLAENRSSVGAVELTSRSIESGADLEELGVAVEVQRDNPAGVIEVLREARLAGPATGIAPPGDERLAELLIELRQAVTEIRTSDLGSEDRVKLRRRQAELERRVRDQARLAPPVSRTRAATRARGDDLGDADRVVAVALSERELIEVTTTGPTAAVRRVPLQRPVTHLLESIEFALHRLNRTGVSSASREVAFRMLDEASTELDSILVPQEIRQSDRPIVVTPIEALHGLPWRVLPSMRSRSVTVSCSVGHPPISQPFGRLLLVAGPGLEHADAEIRGIAAAVPGATIIDAANATITEVIEQICVADIVHFACHGSFRADSPMFSSLQLADGDLTIFELERCADLPHTIVMSACNAGQSAVLRGGALIGMANSLMQLGLSTVVAPLTPVNDESCVELMVGFHERLHRSEDAATALAAVGLDDDGRLDPIAASFCCFGV